ncbi:hypothetical protein ACE4RV_08665 [Acetobacter persici]|uniref:hypothetical protein n=1 Tax=Acetobacter persici TaxID=1076596 RepID=UPI0036D82C10
MSFRVRLDPVFIGQEIGRQCFAVGKSTEDLELLLEGAAYAVCITLAKDKPWMRHEFENIGGLLVKAGLRTFLELLKTKYLEIAPTEGEA